jgi:hypothetical protein
MGESLNELKGPGRGATDFADYTDSKFCETKPFRTSLPSPRRGKYGPLCEICAICGRPHPVPSPVRRARGMRGSRWKITKRTQSVMNRRFKIPDLRGAGRSAVTDRRYSVFPNEPISLFVSLVCIRGSPPKITKRSQTPVFLSLFIHYGDRLEVLDRAFFTKRTQSKVREPRTTPLKRAICEGFTIKSLQSLQKMSLHSARNLEHDGGGCGQTASKLCLPEACVPVESCSIRGRMP